MSATNDARLQVIALARATADDSLDPEAVRRSGVRHGQGPGAGRRRAAAAHLLSGLSYYMHCGVDDVLDEMTRRIVQAEQSGLIGFEFGEEGA